MVGVAVPVPGHDMTSCLSGCTQFSSMPPIPITDIAFRAAQIRAGQALPKSPSRVPPAVARESKSYRGPTKSHSIGINTRASTEPLLHPHVTGITGAPEISAGEGSAVTNEEPGPRQRKDITGYIFSLKPSAATESNPIDAVPVFPPGIDHQDIDHAARIFFSKVPSSRIGRLFHYGGLAASLGYGAASEIIRRSTTTSDDRQQGSLMLTEANINRLVSKLSQMRGAALKLGQFMSIQPLEFARQLPGSSALLIVVRT
ncbi:hypothetical protein EV363DRAFT_1404361 [Boletus edulis]|nr:hypothetical protein EV363DRAFT_1404361 [Boletus edulis]